MTTLTEKISVMVEAVAKLINNLTVKQQTNAAEKVLEKVVEELAGLGKNKTIDNDVLLSAINGLTVEKNFTLLRGQKQKVTIKLGT